MNEKTVIIQYLGGLDTGGAESIVRDYSLELNKRGYKVLVPLYYSTPELPNQKILASEGIEMPNSRGIYHHNVISRGYNKILSFVGHDIKFLKKIIVEYKPKVLHLHGYVLKDFENLDKELDGIKLFYTCHTLPTVLFEGKWKKQKIIAKRLIENNGMRLIALHQDMKIELDSMFGINDTLVLNNPINLSKYSHTKMSKKEVREMLGIPFDAFVIGNVGRFDKSKNHQFLVEVFLQILKKKNESYLLIVGGDGEEKKSILKLVMDKGIANRTIILCDRSDIPELYNAMDCFVFPSQYEGFGIVMVEAQASGLKCYCSTNVPRNTIVTNLVTQIDLNLDSSVWAEIICRDIENKKEKNNINELEKFDIVSIVNTLLDWYHIEI